MGDDGPWSVAPERRLRVFARKSTKRCPHTSDGSLCAECLAGPEPAALPTPPDDLAALREQLAAARNDIRQHIRECQGRIADRQRMMNLKQYAGQDTGWKEQNDHEKAFRDGLRQALRHLGDHGLLAWLAQQEGRGG